MNVGRHARKATGHLSNVINLSWIITCDSAGQGSVDWAAGFLERIAGRHSKDGSADVSIHGRSHFAPLSPLNTTGFSVVRRAILETLTGPEVRTPPPPPPPSPRPDFLLCNGP